MMEQSESERETEFGLMKEMMKKLVYALEDKAATDLISTNNATMNQPSAADTHGSFMNSGNQQMNNSHFHKRQGSLPPEILNRTNRNEFNE